MLNIRTNNTFLVSFFLFLSVKALSIFSYRIGLFDLRPVVLVIFAMAIFGSIILAK